MIKDNKLTKNKYISSLNFLNKEKKANSLSDNKLSFIDACNLLSKMILRSDKTKYNLENSVIRLAISYTSQYDTKTRRSHKRNNFSIILNNPCSFKIPTVLVVDNALTKWEDIPSNLRKVMLKKHIIFFSGDVLKQIEKKIIKFQYLFATSSAIDNLVSVKRILGPRNLYPNKSVSTLLNNTSELLKVLSTVSARKFIIVRDDSLANILVPIGCLSYDISTLVDNYTTIIKVCKSVFSEYTIPVNLYLSINHFPSIKFNSSIAVN